MAVELLIFDMDGTLVQSEDCASQALLDVMPKVTDSLSYFTSNYRGMHLVEILEDVEKRLPGAVPENCIDLYRIRENELSHSMIKPCDGVQTMLKGLRTNKCIASNAPIVKTRRSLEICGISQYFESGVYSAYEVQAWKPKPDLFLYAAADLNTAAANCLVVEDSEVGLQAAKAAGMPAVFYDPHQLSNRADGVRTITALTELLDIVG